MDDEKDIPSLDTVQIDAIKVEDLDLLTDTISISSTNNLAGGYLYSTTPSYSYGNITINTGAGMNGTWGAVGSTGAVGSSFTSPTGLHVTSNAEFDGDVKIKGVSILETLEKIEKRLSILRPDPEKLKHFEALRKAYEHYKTLEALCELPEEPKE